MLYGLGGLSAQNLYLLVNTDDVYQRQLNIYKRQPVVERALDKFTEKVYSVETVDELLNDYESRQFLTQAYNIEGDLANSVAFLKRILTDDLSGEDSLAYRMNDQRFLKMATDLRLDRGLETIRDPVYLAKIRTQYQEIGLEREMGDQNLAVREAMYFKRSIGEVENAYQILADNALRAVVFGVLEIPAEVAYQDIDKQAKIITDRIDLADLKDPDFVENWVNRYLLAEDMENPLQTTGIAATIQPLYFNESGKYEPTIYTLDVNLLI
ncbi:MAG: DUF1217 domain-containing protein [Rhodospirillaceae bacterium]|nr:DUF1217 domain-containing protein [Rhodospirillaceae bacterium]